MQYAGQSNLKQVALECGGKSPKVFMADLADLDRAVTAAYRGIFSNMGEVCNAVSRLLWIGDPRSVRATLRRLGPRCLSAGPPLDPAINMGPLVTREAHGALLGLIDAGKAKEPGCVRRLRARWHGARRIRPPTLFTDVRNDMSIARRKSSDGSRDHSFRRIDGRWPSRNDTIYGLAAGV